VDNKQIAKELAIACLSQANVAAYFAPTGREKAHATAAGEKVGEFYNAIWKTLEQESQASAKAPTVHEF